jgi:hypothetical protein
MTMADGFVSVSRRIEASPERLFALLAHQTVGEDKGVPVIR